MIQSTFKYIPTNRISGNPINPRKFFDTPAIEELAKSIKSYGVLQPIVVYKHEKRYMLICGERRFRAASLSGLKKMPAIVHDKQPEKAAVLAMALVENLQRKDVDLISEASAIKNLIELYNWNFTKVARELGTNPSFVRNRFLLTKHRDVLDSFNAKEISYSEAILVSEIGSHKTRSWLLERIYNGEINGQKKLSDTIFKVKRIIKFIKKPSFTTRKIGRESISLDVENLPSCGASCPHFLRLSWIEKKHFKIDLRNVGWSEFCIQDKGTCFNLKQKARSEILQKFYKFEKKREIPTIEGESMIWMNYEGKSCRQCTSLFQPQDFGLNARNPVCTEKKIKCFNDRQKQLKIKLILSEKIKNAKFNEIDQKIHEQNDVTKKVKSDARLTKNEVCFIISQVLVLMGGEKRLNIFLKSHEFFENAPSGLSDKIKYLHNKLNESCAENNLHEILLKEVSLSYKFVPRKMAPKYFNRITQRVIKLQ